ncbi:MAG: family 10 glycosylhydrolase, partial [Pirellulales bacterium]
MRVRVAWGGGSARQWRGEVRLSEGRLGELRLLGIEADEPGSMWVLPGGHTLQIRQRSPRTYDAFDVFVDAPLSAVLQVDLTPRSPDAAAEDRPGTIRVRLQRLVGDSHSEQLDRQGNRLFVQRSPGDMLRIEDVPDPLIFAPGDRFEATARPHLLPVPEGTKLSLTLELRLRPNGSTGAGQVVWSEQQELRAGRAAAFPVAVRLPEEEGVCELRAVATRAGWPNPVRRPLDWQETIAERKVQMVIVSPRAGGRRAAPAGEGDGSEDFQAVVEFHPANPQWWDLIGRLPRWPSVPKLPEVSPLPDVPRLWKGPLGNHQMRTREHPLGKLVRLNPNRQSPDVSWQAYALPIDQPGRPHVLEVDYPSDVPQTLGISVLEPDATGALMPIGLDSGVGVSVPEVGERGPAKWERHRLVFWPRADSPMVLLYNLRADQPAVYGKIRVLAGPEHLPPGRTVANRGGRRLAAYMDRPLLPENFSAPGAYDPVLRRGLDDWTTFYHAGTRLAEYLDHAGYSGLMLGVLADGSTIYPSELLQSTPRYDTGALLSTGQDPVRKDVLELLCRLFARRGLTLVPSLDFAAPLPALEARLRGGGPETVGMRWVGPTGKTWSETYPKRRGMAAYYNVLHPEVQRAMIEVIEEVVDRYGQHGSFGGVGVQMTAYGYAQLPGPRWGMDDATIRRFTAETDVRVPGSGPGRFARRAGFLARGPQRDVWLCWRAAKLA